MREWNEQKIAIMLSKKQSEIITFAKETRESQWLTKKHKR
jgi:hypothetical protein